MLPIKVNADYESVLAGLGPVPAAVEALEFLAFFLEEATLYSSKSYHSTYLDHVQRLSGKKPEIIRKGEFRNWWGPLQDLEIERRLNSKLTSAVISQELGDSVSIISEFEELLALKERPLLVKVPDSMSGRGFLRIDESINPAHEAQLRKSLARTRLIVEPLLNRCKDFSHFFFPDGRRISYENLIDERFQYKGTILHPVAEANDPRIETIANKFLQEGSSLSHFGFSIDSFVYLEGGVRKIRILSEVNFRRTMGFVADGLRARYSSHHSWSALVLGPSFKAKGGFVELQRRFDFPGVIVLSPGDTRFELLFLSAKSEEEGQALMKNVQALLAKT